MSQLLPIRPSVEETPEQSEVIAIEEDAADEVFDALASGTTRAILTAVFEEPRTASEIADCVDTSIQNVAYHLEKLEAADLVEVAGTGYSSQGREQQVYAPARESLVILASDEETTASLRERITRFLGSVALLGLGGFVVDRLARQVRPSGEEPTVTTVDVPFSADPSASEGVLGVVYSPGVAFFLGGVAVLVAVAVRRRFG